MSMASGISTPEPGAIDPSRSLGISKAAVKFAERIYFEEIGLVGLQIDAVTGNVSRILPVKSPSGAAFFRSEKAMERVVRELRASVRLAAPVVAGRHETLIELDPEATDDAILAAANRIGVELIGSDWLAASITAMVAKIIAMLDRLDRSRQLKTYNAEYRQARIDAKGRGEKMTPYAQWLVDRIGTLIQSGAKNSDNISLFLPAKSKT